jgi:signal transduction histidine kinase
VAPLSIPVEETRQQLGALVTYLQNTKELKDTALAHELHDDLGALMVAAVMDLDAVRRIKPGLSQNLLDRIDQVRATLEQAIVLKRRISERLRPSILDNFGLFAALRWQIKSTWSNSGITSTESFPLVEPQFESGVAIALFRVAQDALSMSLNRASVKSTDLTVRVDEDIFWMNFSDDGTANAKWQPEEPEMVLASMRHRIRVFDGEVRICRTEAGATVLTAWMPMPKSFTSVWQVMR